MPFDPVAEGYVPTKCKTCWKCWMDPSPIRNPGRRCMFGGPYVYSDGMTIEELAEQKGWSPK